MDARYQNICDNIISETVQTDLSRKKKCLPLEHRPGVANVESIYLLRALGEPLKKCLSGLVEKLPADPIEWIAQWLYHYHDTECYLKEKDMFFRGMLEEYCRMQKQKKKNGDLKDIIKEKIRELENAQMENKLSKQKRKISSETKMKRNDKEEPANQINKTNTNNSQLNTSTDQQDMQAHFSSRANIEAHCLSHEDMGAHCSSRADMGAYCSSRTDMGAYCSSRADMGALCSSRADMGAHRSSRVIMGAHCSSRADMGAHCSSRADMGAHCSSRADMDADFIDFMCDENTNRLETSTSGSGKPVVATWAVRQDFRLICKHPILGDLEQRSNIIYPESVENMEASLADLVNNSLCAKENPSSTSLAE